MHYSISHAVHDLRELMIPAWLPSPDGLAACQTAPAFKGLVFLYPLSKNPRRWDKLFVGTPKLEGGSFSALRVCIKQERHRVASLRLRELQR